MATITKHPAPVPAPSPGRSSPEVPPLENGDRLTRPEFERRYSAMPNVKKAELIEGVVYMPSPLSEMHAAPHSDLMFWLGFYRMATPGVVAGDNGTLRLDLDTEPQPDAYVRILTEFGGQARLSPDKYVEGAPELVAEVAATSASYDLHDKFRAYRRNGVREYIVWRVRDQAIDWFILREGQYENLSLSPEGHYRSEVFPGLWLDAAALIRGDLVTVSQVAQSGTASPEHAAFVAKLQQAAASKGS
ncbi:MAG TPA: Uma2 family endonuclease [Isosphaeraceae bacterium]|jgi:Uma2 family endonuclease|nr:Uma2 family endonuclease [Isosphaeraceae bacterium]